VGVPLGGVDEGVEEEVRSLGVGGRGFAGHFCVCVLCGLEEILLALV
jgi:hypothetical protein